MSQVNGLGYASTSAPAEDQVPQGTPPLGKSQASLTLVNKLLIAFKAYEKAHTAADKAGSKLWEEMASLTAMTKDEGEPILAMFLKAAREDKEKFPQAVSTVVQYASRVRMGWKAGVAVNEGEGANAFYKRAQEANNGVSEAPEADAGEGSSNEAGEASAVTGERAKLMTQIRKELTALTNAELVEVAKWLAHKNSRKAAPQQKAA